MGQQYPELLTERRRIETVALAEENAFLEALNVGTNILDTAVTDTKAAGSTVLAGEKAFLLHDTWGFPIDLTLEMAAEQGLSVDEDGFRRLMKEQRDRAKADARAKKSGHADLSAYREVADAAGPTHFTGYHSTENEATVVGLLVNGATAPAAAEGDEVEVVLDRTPVLRRGRRPARRHRPDELDNGAVVEVRDVQQPVPGVIVHKGVVRVGEVVPRRRACAAIDIIRRRAIARAHSATHLTHQALRDALGPTAAQAGSENSPGRFRFDFGSPAAVPGTVLTDVEQKINEVLARELDVHAEVMSMDDAKKQGAIAEFGEKYGDRVRVVTIGDFSKELCGGTHVHNTAQLGLVKLLGESSIGSGVRRVEALVGVDAYKFLAREHTVVSQLTELVKGRPEELPEKSPGADQAEDAEKEIERSARRRCCRPPPGSPRAPPTSGASRWSPARCPTAPPRRPAQAGPRRPRPHPRRPPGGRRAVHRGQRPPGDRHRHQRGRPRARSQGRRPGPHRGQDPRRRRRRQAGRRPGRRPEPRRDRRRHRRRRAPRGRGGLSAQRTSTAIDVGDARIGVASCDPDGILATPVETVPGRDVPAAHRRLAARRGVRAARGRRRAAPLPEGGEGPAAAKVRGFAQDMAGHRTRTGPAGRRTYDYGHRQPRGCGPRA